MSDAPPGFRRVLVVYDGSDIGGRAMELGVEALHHQRRMLSDATALAAGHGIDVTGDLRVGDRCAEIVRATADHRCDLVVIPSAPSLHWWQPWGLDATRVARRAPCSVLVAR